jgi:hypothetical protein
MPDRPLSACNFKESGKRFSVFTSIGERKTEMLGTILVVILILLLLGALPTWPHSRSWGYGPSGGLGLVVVILIILWLMGRLPF